ncbi:MAG: hypothetical protein ABI813_15010 [Bacteroidota bacterium]
MLSDTVDYMFVSMRLSLDATYITATLKIVSFAFLIKLSGRINWQIGMPARAITFFKLMIAWNIITIVRGVFSAEDYWDWKYLIVDTSFSLLIPFAIVVGLLFDYSRGLFAFVVTRIFLLGFLIIPLTLQIDPDRELFARGLVMSVCFFILLSPYFVFKWRLLTFIVAATSIYIAFDFRTNIIRIAAATAIISLYYIRNHVSAFFLKLACFSFFITPLVLLFLGVTNQYNIFQPVDSIDQYEYSYDNGADKNIAVDTRTFLYQEVFASMQTNNSFIAGEGGTGSYRTQYFEDNVNPGKGRKGAEVGFLNILLYSGIIGVIFYALMLFSAAYYAINQSNNFLCKIIALFLAFRWVLFFIEDFTGYDINYYFIWVAAGLCFSKKFRSLTDADIIRYFNFKKHSWNS